MAKKDTPEQLKGMRIMKAVKQLLDHEKAQLLEAQETEKEKNKESIKNSRRQSQM